MRRGLLVFALVIAGAVAPAHATAVGPQPAGPNPPLQPLMLAADPVANDDGRHLDVHFFRPEANQAPGARVISVVLRDTGDPDRPFAWVPLPLGVKPEANATHHLTYKIIAVFTEGETTYTDEVEPGASYRYVAVEARIDDEGRVTDVSVPAVSQYVAPRAALFHTKRWGYLVIVLGIAALILFYTHKARRDAAGIFIRRMPGVDAIEDAVGRSTEMGRPVLYVTGLDQIQDIQTIASLLILGHVAKLTATYDTDIKVANYYPLTMVVAEEIVRQGYANAGRLDAHHPENVLFISAEQFAFAAGVNGLILRDRPATNIYFGKFFGESLLLAETGFLTGAVQIAGTAELAQLPFFVAACDYTLIGEEMYATSAYLSREPSLLANLKAGDALKAAAVLFVVVGVVLATAGVFDLGPEVFP